MFTKGWSTITELSKVVWTEAKWFPIHFPCLQYHDVELGDLRLLPALTFEDLKNGLQGRMKAITHYVLWSGSMAHPCLPSINPLTSSSLSQPPGWHAPVISSVPSVRRQGAFRRLRETDCVQTLAIQGAILQQWKWPGPGKTFWIKHK